MIFPVESPALSTVKVRGWQTLLLFCFPFVRCTANRGTTLSSGYPPPHIPQGKKVACLQTLFTTQFPLLTFFPFAFLSILPCGKTQQARAEGRRKINSRIKVGDAKTHSRACLCFPKRTHTLFCQITNYCFFSWVPRSRVRKRWEIEACVARFSFENSQTFIIASRYNKVCLR